ncbi:hypothetical protein MYX78_12795, partial [Acidobacteria bacterium AH-259-G07]|nr:hypothetical protein [Acidobacteria bacterium AH-259-G07]
FLMAITLSAFLLLFGLSMTLSSMSEFSMSTNLENKTKAMMTAEGGYNIWKSALRDMNLNDLLATSTSVPRYINYTEPAPSTSAYPYFIRNPLAPIEAMNVDFDNPPAPIGNRTVNGLLTSASGETLAGGGRYWAKITDNDDGDSDLTADVDGTVFLRVLAVEKSLGQISTYGGTVKNSVAIIEGMFKHDTTLDFSAPFTIYGPGADPAVDAKFKGDAFLFDGYDHSAMTLADLQSGTDTHTTGGDSAGIEVIFDNPPGDATVAKTSIYDKLKAEQKDNFIGNTSDYTGPGEPSLRDVTDSIRNDPNPDAQNIFDANYVMNFIEGAAALADITVSGGQIYSADLGSEADPKITYCEWSSCKLAENASGAGLLIVNGKLEIKRNFSYHGLVLVIGAEMKIPKDGNTNILGGLFLARLVPDGAGGYAYGVPKIEIDGTHKFYYSGNGIRLGYSLLPFKCLAWREIIPEIEPTN